MATLTSEYQYLGRSSVMTSKSGSLSYYILLYGKTSANQATGIHTVTIKEILASTNNSSYYSYTQEHNGKINGTTAFSGTNKPSKAWELSSFTQNGVTYKTGTLLGEGSVNVDCTNGLKKDITLSCYYAFKSTGDSYTPSNGTNRTVSVTATLSAIPRASIINTFRGNDIEGNFSVTYTSYSSTFTNKLRISIPNVKTLETFDNYKSGENVYLSNANVQYLFDYMQDSPTVDLSAVIETWNGNTKLGESEALTNTCSVDNALPIITASVIDSNDATYALTGNRETLIKYYSNAKATMSAEAQKGAAINEDLYIIRNGVNTGYGTEHTFENVESNEFIFTAEDSRGGVGRASVTLPMVEYTKLTCNIANNRPDALGNMTVACTGDFFNNSFGKVENTLTVQYRYTIYGVPFKDDWTNMSVTKNGNSYYASADFVIPDFSQQTFYSFETRAIDELDTVLSNESSVKSIPIFHWGENDFVFEVPVTFNAGINDSGVSGISDDGDQTVNGNLNVTGNLRLKGSGNYGNTLLFGDGTYCYISEPEDDVMHIKAKRIDLNANGVYVYGNPIPDMQKGTWSPTLNSNAISYYTTQYGWYSKMGQTVTVGFYIKATCNSGYQSTSISISGLPFTPMFSAAGGGMCSGAYISGGYDFQCFVVETSGSITTRVQSCNNTSATNISTSASGCNYRNGGGEITLSGTITFMANS